MNCAQALFERDDARRLLLLILLSLTSGLLGSLPGGLNWGAAPGLGLFAPMTGVWFALVIAYAIRRLANVNALGVTLAFFCTWCAWEVAVNFAIQVDSVWLTHLVSSPALRMAIAGFGAGAIGAMLTWMGAAAAVATLRRPRLAVYLTAIGALIGLLLPVTDVFDSPAVLFMTWEVAIATVLGWAMSRGATPTVGV